MEWVASGMKERISGMPGDQVASRMMERVSGMQEASGVGAIQA